MKCRGTIERSEGFKKNGAHRGAQPGRKREKRAGRAFKDLALGAGKEAIPPRERENGVMKPAENRRVVFCVVRRNTESQRKKRLS